MKVVVKNVQDADRELTYPCLGKFSDEDTEYVVLFSKPNQGMVVAIIRQPEDRRSLFVGEMSTTDEYFVEGDFTYFTGEVSLSN